jgi:hypothetical protein
MKKVCRLQNIFTQSEGIYKLWKLIHPLVRVRVHDEH